MSYWALNAVFLVAALAVGTPAALGLKGRGRSVALAAVFDNLMIAAGLFTYAPWMFSGVMVGLAPLEDFAYSVAAVLLLPGLWMLLVRRSAASRAGRQP